MFDVIGFGSSVLDIIVDVEDEFIEENKLMKGNFLLIDDEKTKEFDEKLKGKKIVKLPGGSVSNIISGVALLGGKAAYIGGVGEDDYGKEYVDKTKKEGIEGLFVHKGGTTGRCMAFITEDGERTFAVNLGKCNFLSEQDVEPDFEAKILLIEGYKLEHEGDYAVAVKLAKYAKEKGTKIALDVNDAGVIKRAGKKMTDFIKRYVDVLFMNEDEAEALTGFKDEKALEKVEEMSGLTVLKVGEKGSFVRENGKTVKVMPKKVDVVVNTNGAGDAYAAAFLFGLSKGMSIEKIGQLSSIFSSAVVSEQGARIRNLSEEIKELIKTNN